MKCKTVFYPDIDGKVRVWSLDNEEHPLKKEVVVEM